MKVFTFFSDMFSLSQPKTALTHPHDYSMTLIWRTHASLMKASMKLLIRIHNLQSRVVLQLEHIWADWIDIYRVHSMQIMKHIYDAWDSSFCRSQEKDPTLHEPAIMHYSRAAVGVDWGMSAWWNETDFSHMRAESGLSHADFDGSLDDCGGRPKLLGWHCTSLNLSAQVLAIK